MKSMSSLIEIATLRAQGMGRLQEIAEEMGADSRLYRRCRELWLEREAWADVSVTSGDPENAITLLELGLHALRHGPDLLKKDGLSLDDAVRLLGAA